jgi:hypothetical protein
MGIKLFKVMNFNGETYYNRAYEQGHNLNFKTFFNFIT